MTRTKWAPCAVEGPAVCRKPPLLSKGISTTDVRLLAFGVAQRFSAAIRDKMSEGFSPRGTRLVWDGHSCPSPLTLHRTLMESPPPPAPPWEERRFSAA
jgi:hypothetical protein